MSATGTVSGSVFFDRNGNKVNDAGDTVLGGVRVRLLPRGSHDTLGKATTDELAFAMGLMMQVVVIVSSLPGALLWLRGREQATGAKSSLTSPVPTERS